MKLPMKKNMCVYLFWALLLFFALLSPRLALAEESSPSYLADSADSWEEYLDVVIKDLSFEVSRMSLEIMLRDLISSQRLASRLLENQMSLEREASSMQSNFSKSIENQGKLVRQAAALKATRGVFIGTTVVSVFLLGLSALTEGFTGRLVK